MADIIRGESFFPKWNQVLMLDNVDRKYANAIVQEMLVYPYCVVLRFQYDYDRERYTLPSKIRPPHLYPELKLGAKFPLYETLLVIDPRCHGISPLHMVPCLSKNPPDPSVLRLKGGIEGLARRVSPMLDIQSYELVQRNIYPQDPTPSSPPSSPKLNKKRKAITVQ